ncbi:MAG: hypothetical protein K6G42_05025, partial [Lachnospiraceae bacterium]|nr:hypothetical protein [Lachnospiraceae bacterium]
MRNKNAKGKQNNILKRIAQLSVVAVVAVVAVIIMRRNALALFNEQTAMHYSEYSSSHTIENSVLFVGTYLININAMTDELYQKAQDSASESNQTNIYYKSELADGAWFDVTDAETLTDIMNNSTAVSESDLADLYVQYYVGADGVMVDVMDDSEVNPFDVPDPYNLSKLKELEPLWLYYTSSTSADEISQEDYLKNKNSGNTGNKRTDVYTHRLLTTFFSLDLRDEDTDKYDADLARLNEAYKSLKASGQDDEAQTLYSLMAKVDASRRAIIMDKLAVMEINLLDVLFDLANGKYYTVSGNFYDSTSENNLSEEPDYIVELQDALVHEFEKGDDGGDEWWGALQSDYEKDIKTVSGQGSSFNTDSSLIDAIGNSSGNCQQSYNTYHSQALVDSDSVLGHAEYEYSEQVIDQASADGAGGPLNYLMNVLNIKNGVIKDAKSEINLLDSSLLDLAEGNYEEALTLGEPKEYSNIVEKGGGASSGETVLKEQMDKVEAKRTELEFLIDAYKQRAAAADALTYV